MKLGTKQIGTVTVVYVAEDEYGDKTGWITQSYPTNFHSFWQEKSLVKGDSVDNYKWVSDAEKTTIEENDAKWEEPSEEFVKQVKSLNLYSMAYNPNTGFFELNGLKDLTESQVRETINHLITHPWVQSIDGVTNIRTVSYKHNGPLNSYDRSPTLFATFRNLPNLEVIRIADSTYGVRPSSTSTDIISNCKKLTKIIGKIDCSYVVGGISVVRNCPELTDITLHKVTKSLACLGQKLNIASVSYMIDNAANNGAEIYIRYHLDVYCKLLSSLTEEEATDIFQDEAKLTTWRNIKATLTKEEQEAWGEVYKAAGTKNIKLVTT